MNISETFSDANALWVSATRLIEKGDGDKAKELLKNASELYLQAFKEEPLDSINTRGLIAKQVVNTLFHCGEESTAEFMAQSYVTMPSIDDKSKEEITKWLQSRGKDMPKETTKEIDDDTWAILCYLAELIPGSVLPFALNDISGQFPGHRAVEVLRSRYGKIKEASQEFFGEDVPEF